MKVLLLALAVAVTAAEPHCNRMDRLVVKEQWNRAYGHGIDRENFCIAIFQKFFDIDPEARAMFARVRGDNLYSPEFKAHCTRFLGGVDMAVSFLDDEAVLNSALAHLSQQHEPRAVTADQFRNFGKAMNRVIPSIIGRCYNQDAWHGCFKIIRNGIGAYLEPAAPPPAVQLPENGDAVQLPEGDSVAAPPPAVQLPEKGDATKPVQLPEN